MWPIGVQRECPYKAAKEVSIISAEGAYLHIMNSSKYYIFLNIKGMHDRKYPVVRFLP